MQGESEKKHRMDEGGNTGAAATSALRPLHKCNVHRAARSSLFRLVPDCQTFLSI